MRWKCSAAEINQPPRQPNINGNIHKLCPHRANMRRKNVYSSIWLHKNLSIWSAHQLFFLPPFSPPHRKERRMKMVFHVVGLWATLEPITVSLMNRSADKLVKYVFNCLHIHRFTASGILNFESMVMMMAIRWHIYDRSIITNWINKMIFSVRGICTIASTWNRE